MQRRPNNTTRRREDNGDGNGDGLTASKVEINESKSKPMSKRCRDVARHLAVRICICLVFAVGFALQFKLWPTTSSSTSTSTTESTSSAARSGVLAQQRENATAAGYYEETTLFNLAKNDPERAPILRILEQGGYILNGKFIFDDETLAMLPKWSEIQQLYGPPKIVGLEQCQEFQQTIPVTDQAIGVAGMFNSGTNLLSVLLATNCIHTARMGDDEEASTTGMIQAQVQVPWGKHMPASLRGNHTTTSPESRHAHYFDNATLPVITVRDPYTWMQSMCRQGYVTQFEHSIKLCPNIIPYKEDIQAHPRFAKMKYIPVNVRYTSDLKVKYESLVHYWNVWYSEYIDSQFPRLVVRMEDLLFHGEEVVTQICECGGGTMRKQQPFTHVKQVANRNLGIEQTHKLAGLIGSLIKYGNATTRKKGYPPFQLQAARHLLNSTLMQLFRYPYEKVPQNSSTMVEGTADEFI